MFIHYTKCTKRINVGTLVHYICFMCLTNVIESLCNAIAYILCNAYTYIILIIVGTSY